VTIYVYPADKYGCGHYRMIWPAAAAAAQGHDVKIVMPGSRQGIGGDIDLRTNRAVSAFVPPDAEAIVLQRVSMLNLASGIPLLRDQGVAVIVDMDDDLARIDPSNPAWVAMRKDMGVVQHNWENAVQACLDATMVTVSTPALLKTYAPHGRGVVVRNTVPRGYLGIEHVDRATFGWPGSIHSHPSDLPVLGAAVARLIREGYKYWGVGPNYGYAPGDGMLHRAFGMTVDEDDLDTAGNTDFDDYPRKVANMGVVLAPLADTVFNTAKSWLKPLEAMACGVPWVASPRAEYAELARTTGVGFLANNPRQWYQRAKTLLDDDDLRAEQTQAGRQAAADYTVEGNAWRWIEAWTDAVKIQRQVKIRTASYLRR